MAYYNCYRQQLRGITADGDANGCFLSEEWLEAVAEAWLVCLLTLPSTFIQLEVERLNSSV